MADSPPDIPPNQHMNMHVRGYKEKGNINTPLELAINNEIDRFSLAIDVIDRTPKLQRIGAHAKESTATGRPNAATTLTNTVSTSRKLSGGNGHCSPRTHTLVRAQMTIEPLSSSALGSRAEGAGCIT